MALIPLNTFKTKTATLSTSNTSTIYTSPIGVTAIILMAQVTNLTTQTQYVTFGHFRNLPVLPDSQGNGAQTGTTFTEMVKDYPVPANDAASMTTGKMIIESLDSIRCYTGSENSLKITLSVLETANQ
jgi:hypothetical protein